MTHHDVKLVLRMNDYKDNMYYDAKICTDDFVVSCITKETYLSKNTHQLTNVAIGIWLKDKSVDLVESYIVVYGKKYTIYYDELKFKMTDESIIQFKKDLIVYLSAKIKEMQDTINQMGFKYNVGDCFKRQNRSKNIIQLLKIISCDKFGYNVELKMYDGFKYTTDTLILFPVDLERYYQIDTDSFELIDLALQTQHLIYCQHHQLSDILGNV